MLKFNPFSERALLKVEKKNGTYIHEESLKYIRLILRNNHHEKVVFEAKKAIITVVRCAVIISCVGNSIRSNVRVLTSA